MKKILLIIGIVSIIACILCLIFGVLNLLGYYNILDGSANLYDRLHQRMVFSFVIGIVFAVIGTACIILQYK